MDRLPTSYNGILSEEKDHPGINYTKILQFGEQLMSTAKQATQSNFVTHDEMERLCQVGDLLQKEVQNVRNELIRRKNLELLLPSPNTQKHLPCSNLLSPSSPPITAPLALSPVGPPENSVTPVTNMSTATNQDYWPNKKIVDPKTRGATAPMYVNLTEQMIIAQASKRKRPVEGALYCHNCKTKDTPEWRRGPSGAKTLCNACGIRWRLSQGETKFKKGCNVIFDANNRQHSVQILSTQPTQLLSPHSPPYPPHAIQQQLLIDLHRRSTNNNNTNSNVPTVIATGVA